MSRIKKYIARTSVNISTIMKTFVLVKCKKGLLPFGF